jgi:hypothetical protein
MLACPALEARRDFGLWACKIDARGEYSVQARGEWRSADTLAVSYARAPRRKCPKSDRSSLFGKA